jgi:prophage regulatory protein
MPTKFIRRREVQEVTGLCRSALYQRIADGEFPKPVKLGPRAVAWIEEEIEVWKSQRIAERDAEASL